MARDELLRYGITSLVGIDNVLCARAYHDPPMSQLILSLHLLLVKSNRPTLQCRVVYAVAVDLISCFRLNFRPRRCLCIDRLSKVA